MWDKDVALHEIESRGGKVNFCYILFFNHIKCRIDRYLMNMSEPYSVKFIELPNTSKYGETSLQLLNGPAMIDKSYPLLKGQALKYIFKEDKSPNNLEAIPKRFTSDGKLSLKFIRYFLFEAMISIFRTGLYGPVQGFHSYANHFDFNIINSYENRLVDLKLNLLSNSINHKAYFPPLGKSREICCYKSTC